MAQGLIPPAVHYTSSGSTAQRLPTSRRTPSGSCTSRTVLPPRPVRVVRLWQLPPPGSFWIGSGDEEIDDLLLDPGNMPKTYEPLMGYPGTMRPGMTPENMPYQDLPIADSDPDPVPWPHFQEIQWHHRWPPPHPNPDTMEDVIEKAGRWATPEQEAMFRAGARNTVRELQARAEAKQREWVITDDEVEPGEQDTEETLETVAEEGDTFVDGRLAFGEDNLFGTLGSDDDRALTERATSPRARKMDEAAAVAAKQKQPSDTMMADDGLDDFFLDLGLDLDLDDESSSSSSASEDGTMKAPPKTNRARIGEVEEFDESDIAEEETTPSLADKGVTSSIEVEEDDDELAVLGLGDDDDAVLGDDTVPLEDFDADETDTGTENFFDEGGFDLDDGGDYGGGDDDWDSS
jgi:hypothetical protein